jgi:hypothetical protein
MRPEQLLKWYPDPWRDRYGEEFLACISDTIGPEPNVPLDLAIRIAGAGLRERAHASGLVGTAADADTRIRSGALTVLTGWALFVVAGAAFAKRTEHAGHDAARATVQILAIVAVVAIAAGGLAVVPAVGRHLREGGWAAHRRLIAVWLSVTTVTLASTVALIILARMVPASDRVNGGGWYGIAFIAWSLCVVTTLGCSVVVAWVLGRQIRLTRPVRSVEQVVVGVIAAAMFTMTVVVVAVASASAAGSIIGNGVVIIVTMIAADAIASFGLSRAWRLE